MSDRQDTYEAVPMLGDTVEVRLGLFFKELKLEDAKALRDSLASAIAWRMSGQGIATGRRAAGSLRCAQRLA